MDISRVIVPEDFKEPKEANIWRFYPAENSNSFVIDFGKLNDKREIEVLSSISLPPDLLGLFVEHSLEFGYDMNKKFDLKIGFFNEIVSEDASDSKGEE